jgi:hypothetical protein
MSLVGRCANCEYKLATTNTAHPSFSAKRPKVPPPEYDPVLTPEDIKGIKGALKFLRRVDKNVISMKVLENGKIRVRTGTQFGGSEIIVERTKFAWHAVATLGWSSNPPASK